MLRFSIQATDNPKVCSTATDDSGTQSQLLNHARPGRPRRVLPLTTTQLPSLVSAPTSMYNTTLYEIRTDGQIRYNGTLRHGVNAPSEKLSLMIASCAGGHETMQVVMCVRGMGVFRLSLKARPAQYSTCDGCPACSIPDRLPAASFVGCPRDDNKCMLHAHAG